MEKSLFITLLMTICTLLSCQSTKKPNDFNLSFEQVESDIPVKWNYDTQRKDYHVRLDNRVSKDGENSVSIESTPEKYAPYCSIFLTIPYSYEGSKITLSGYIKTENITDGYAGLWMRIDPEIGFDNMDDRGLKGTNDWTKCEITLDLKPNKTDRIVIGGILAGQGKMWVDDLKITIDGEDIETLEPLAVGYPIDRDQEFDNGSKITNIAINEHTTKNLYDLGLIWGLLKYYHPSVAAGNYNWDYELFHIMPKIVGETDVAKRDAILTDWIDGLGDFEIMDSPKPTEQEVKLEPDLAWIDSLGFSKELTDVLNGVKMAKRRDRHHYVHFSATWPKFTNERRYAKMRHDDIGYRILSLYRYWNAIQYYFPYRYLIGEDWKGVLKEFIPLFVNTNNEYKYTLNQIICRINDTHAYLQGFVLPGTSRAFIAAPYLRFVENKAVVYGFFDHIMGKKSGLRLGDVITQINGEKVEDIVNSRLDITSGSNYVSKLNAIAPHLFRSSSNSIKVSYLRNGVEKEINIEAYDKFKPFDTRFQTQNEKSFSMINDNISYLYPGLLKEGYMEKFWPEIKKSKALIVDMRCYPSVIISYTFCNKLLPNETPCVIFTSASTTTPGEFAKSPVSKFGLKNDDYFKGQVIILVNETTLSNAEFTTMIFRQAPDAIVIGSTTAAADGNIVDLNLPGGLTTTFTGLGVYTPEGGETQRVGIIPDIEIRPTITGVKAGRDEVLEKAIEVINN